MNVTSMQQLRFQLHQDCIKCYDGNDSKETWSHSQGGTQLWLSRDTTSLILQPSFLGCDGYLIYSAAYFRYPSKNCIKYFGKTLIVML